MINLKCLFGFHNYQKTIRIYMTYEHCGQEYLSGHIYNKTFCNNCEKYIINNEVTYETLNGIKAEEYLNYLDEYYALALNKILSMQSEEESK